MTRPGPWIAVVGPGSGAAEDELIAAEEAGALLADSGAVLVCGGLGGVMEAACRGARSRFGVTVGLLPGTDREDANGWVSLAIPTGLGEGRNALVVRAADAVVAIGGGWGTLSEIAFACKRGIPVVGVSTWDLGVEDGVEIVAGGGADAVARALELVAAQGARGSVAEPVPDRHEPPLS